MLWKREVILVDAPNVNVAYGMVMYLPAFARAHVKKNRATYSIYKVNYTVNSEINLLTT